MECELWAALSGPRRAWERATAGIAREEEVQAWPGSNSRPPNELVECQLLGFREMQILAWLHLSKCSLAVCLEQQLSGERNSCQGRERSGTLSRRSVYLPRKIPIASQGGGDLLRGTDPSQTPIVRGRPMVSRLEWPGVWE